MFVPEISDLRNDEDKHYYAYSIRMCLLPQVYSLDGFHFDCCQLSSRHWIIRAKDTVVADISGEGVIGLVRSQLSSFCGVLEFKWPCFYLSMYTKHVSALANNFQVCHFNYQATCHIHPL